MFKLTKKKVGIGVAVGAVAIAAPFAYSYWTQGGTGTGEASTGTTAAIEVDQTSVVEGLYPGGPRVELSGVFLNPDNEFPVYVERVTADVTGTSAGEDCAAGNFTITSDNDDDPTNDDNEITIQDEIDDQTAWGGLYIQMENLDENQDLCKDVTVNISYEAHALAAE
ncbi:MAG: hypothetical protein KGZ72_11890 [Roseovarius sp.]|jgi:hypothetical protein|nr:hypothetical protein [Roseovarius sp.]